VFVLYPAATLAHRLPCFWIAEICRKRRELDGEERRKLSDGGCDLTCLAFFDLLVTPRYRIVIQINYKYSNIFDTRKVELSL